MGQLPKFNTENEDQKVEKIAMTPEMKGKNNSVPIYSDACFAELFG